MACGEGGERKHTTCMQGHLSTTSDGLPTPQTNYRTNLWGEIIRCSKLRWWYGSQVLEKNKC
jgi:hypothetical protein